jgi:hypothetical protein
MERRRFIQRLFEAFVLGGLFLLWGCAKKENQVTFGNQERLWQLVSEKQKIEEPIELAYSKETPALYRDASMGKVDPNFVPRLTGG